MQVNCNKVGFFQPHFLLNIKWAVRWMQFWFGHFVSFHKNLSSSFQEIENSFIIKNCHYDWQQPKAQSLVRFEHHWGVLEVRKAIVRINWIETPCIGWNKKTVHFPPIISKPCLWYYAKDRWILQTGEIKHDSQTTLQRTNK